MSDAETPGREEPEDRKPQHEDRRQRAMVNAGFPSGHRLRPRRLPHGGGGGGGLFRAAERPMTIAQPTVIRNPRFRGLRRYAGQPAIHAGWLSARKVARP